MKVQQINSTNFQAKLYPGTVGGVGNKKLLTMFEQKTANLPKLALAQEMLNFSGKDYFSLLNEKGERLVSGEAHHSCFSYSCIEEAVDRFVDIFNNFVKQAKDAGKLV